MEKIISLSDQEGLDIVVEDYLEDTDIDIWIQLLVCEFYSLTPTLQLPKLVEKPTSESAPLRQILGERVGR